MDGNLVYLDSSGILAFLNQDDTCHQAARGAGAAALKHNLKMVMADYVRLDSASVPD